MPATAIRGVIVHGVWAGFKVGLRRLLGAGPLLLWLAILLVSLTSMTGIGSFATMDEEYYWHGARIPNFWRGMANPDQAEWIDLAVCNKPGITTAWFGGLGLLLPGPWNRTASTIGDTDPIHRSIYAFDDEVQTSAEAEIQRIELRDHVRTQQRMGCYLACAAALILCGLTLRVATQASGESPVWFVRTAGPILALGLLSDPIIRNNIRLALTDGLMGALALLGVCTVAYALSKEQAAPRRAWGAHAAAGAAMAGAMLSKYSAFFALLTVGVAMFVWQWSHTARKDGSDWKEVARRGVNDLGGVFIPYAIGFLVTALLMEPLAWQNPLHVGRLFEMAESAGGMPFPWLLGIATVAGLASLALIPRLRQPVLGLITPRRVFAACIGASGIIAIAILTGLVWQHGKPIVYNHENVLGQDYHTWYMENTYTFETGPWTSRLLNTRWMMTTLANTLPEHVVGLLMAAPLLLFWGLRRLSPALSLRFSLVLLLLQGYFLFSALLQGPGLLPLGIRYQLQQYFPLTAMAGLVVLIVALALRRFTALPVVAYAVLCLATHLSTLNVYDDYLNTFRSRSAENAFSRREDGVINQDFIAVDGVGAYMVEAARYLNQKYLALTPEQRDKFLVFVDSPTFRPFTFTKMTKNPNRACYAVWSRASLYRLPELVNLLQKKEPEAVIAKQGVPFIWIFSFPERMPRSTDRTL